MTERHLRQVADGEEQRTTALELFFDLVFVFAITQLSHLLVEHLDLEGAAQTVFLLLVVWWAWIYTTWMTNWFDPDAIAVRAVLILVALASLLMAIAIPDAFGERAVMFAASYAGLQIVRNAFAAFASPPGSVHRENFVADPALVGRRRRTVGGRSVPTRRGPHRGVARCARRSTTQGPYAGYWVPCLGRVGTEAWQIEALALRRALPAVRHHRPRRVDRHHRPDGLRASTSTRRRVGAIAVAFLGSAALWWLYFDYVARIAELRLSLSDDPGRLARDAYTYIHIPIIAGMIVTAVGDELVIAHPTERLDGAELAAVVGGPALYLIGHVAFRVAHDRNAQRKRLAAAVACACAGVLGLWMDAIWVRPSSSRSSSP